VATAAKAATLVDMVADTEEATVPAVAEALDAAALAAAETLEAASLATAETLEAMLLAATPAAVMERRAAERPPIRGKLMVARRGWRFQGAAFACDAHALGALSARVALGIRNDGLRNR